MELWLNAIVFGLLVIQIPAVAIWLSRLLQGPRRYPPLEPQWTTVDLLGQVSIIVPTLNEAKRIAPCLAGLSRQGYEVREIIVVDSHSQDGTPDLVKAAQQRDPRFRVIEDAPLPTGWVGRPWALHTGFLQSSPHSEWILGIDADTQPQPGLVASLVKAAIAGEYDLVSLAPQFILKSPGEFWLQPALLLTLVYRFGPAGNLGDAAERVMANGQCFLCRRALLEQLEGYSTARASFCDDVTLARYAASQGAKVGFLDGARIIKVRMYEGVWETWQEWGRSLDLKDAASVQQIWGDLWLLVSVQGLPLPLTLLLLSQFNSASLTLLVAFGLNLGLVGMRVAMMAAITASYDRSHIGKLENLALWLSPLADPFAVLRIFLSSINTPKQWRGRLYS
jgi:dolichol-phosphate mannosyltransferase